MGKLNPFFPACVQDVDRDVEWYPNEHQTSAKALPGEREATVRHMAGSPRRNHGPTKARARQAEQPAAPAPQPRPLTAGQAARKARHEAKEAARHAARAKAFANYNESVRYSYSLLDKELALAAAKAGR